MKPLLITCLLLIAVPCLAGPVTPTDYNFKLGHWRIEAKAMQPDQSHVQGAGTGHVYRNAIGVIQDDLCIEMEQIPNVVGTTMRSMDSANNLWYVTWVSNGNPTSTGEARHSDSTMLERFPGTDQHGAFVDEMRFTVFDSDHYRAELNRTYENGNVRLECIWCYDAKRVNEPESSQCNL